MEFAQLRHFVALAEILHFGQCAQRLGIAQPHLSRSIASLEAELAVRLFVRTSRRVDLTPAGTAFLAEVFEILHAQQRAIHASRTAQSNAGETLRIGFVSAASFHLLPAAIRQMRTIMDVRVELLELSTNEQIDMLLDGKLDLALGHPPVATTDRIVTEILRSDGYDVLLSAGHPMAGRKSVAFEEIAAEEFVLFPESQGPVLYNKFRQLCREAGKEMAVSQVATRLQTIQSLVCAGLGIGFAQMDARGFHVEGTIRVPLDPYPETLRLELAAFRDRLNRKKSLKMFLDVARKMPSHDVSRSLSG